MRKLKIPKKNGTFRIIYAPSNYLKEKLRKLNTILEKKVRTQDTQGVIHGFVRGRSPVTNATAHKGLRFSLSFDLENFFDTVTEGQVKNFLSEEERKLCFVDGAPRQGLPTSPSVANLAALAMDAALLRLRKKSFAPNFVYTRYADDLTFSFDDWWYPFLMEEVPKIIRRCGFKVNLSKTSLQDAHSGRRIITGVAIEDCVICPTRKAKRKLRATLHQEKAAVAAGHAEWCKLKTPNNTSPYDKEIAALAELWKFKIRMTAIPNKGEAIEDGDFLITGDPVYTLGMTSFASGWSSCLGWPTGAHRRSTLFWVYLRGSKIAMRRGDRTIEYNGVKRRSMLARTIVYEFRNGQKAYGKLYGNSEYNRRSLKEKLEKHGYSSLSEVTTNTKVVGNVPIKWVTPYIDSDTVNVVTLKNEGKSVYVLKSF